MIFICLFCVVLNSVKNCLGCRIAVSGATWILSLQNRTLQASQDCPPLHHQSVCFQTGGVLSLIQCTLIEEPDASDDDCKSRPISWNSGRIKQSNSAALYLTWLRSTVLGGRSDWSANSLKSLTCLTPSLRTDILQSLPYESVFLGADQEEMGFELNQDFYTW